MLTKRIALAIGTILSLLIGWQLYLYTGIGTVSLDITPKDASFVIDKISYSAKQAGSVNLKPGSHKITIAPDGYTAVTRDFDLGWRQDMTFKFVIQPKKVKDILTTAAPNLAGTGYESAQEKFFLNNTWATSYIIPDAEGGDIAVAVLHRVNGAWTLVFMTDSVGEKEKAQIPSVVYDYIKGLNQ